MEQPAQIITETVPTPLPVPASPQPPVIPKKSNKILLTLLVVLVLFLGGGLVYAGYKLGQLYREPAKVQRIDCQNDSDCVLVTNKKDCCSCPTPVNKEELEKNKDLIKWPKITLEVIPTPPGGCKNVVCSPCPWWNKVVCESGVCKGTADLSPTPSPFVSTPTPDPTVGWKTYTNTKYGYEFKYPANWQMAAPSGEVNYPGCLENPGDVAIIEISKTKLSECGFLAEQIPPQEADITIWADNQEWEKLNLMMGQSYEEIILAGEKAIKYAFTEKSELPNVQATRIYFNHKGKKYLIFLKQVDKKGNYDSIYDQVLSTFKFLD